MTIAAIAVVVLLSAIGLHAMLIAPRALRQTVIEFPLPGLSSSFDGYTLAVIADIHHWGAGIGSLRRIVNMANEASADLIVLLGDYGISFEHRQRLSASTYETALPALTDALRRLRARDGCIAVLGNHDHYYDGNRIASWLRSLGVRVLINEHHTVHRDGAVLVIGGVGDAYEDRVDSRGGTGTQPSGTPIVVLSHNPDAVRQLDRDAGIGLILAGHTHGGQIVLPGYGALTTHTQICGRTTASGWIPNEVAALYVTRGVGAQVPVRFRCPPELLIVRLRASIAQQPA